MLACHCLVDCEMKPFIDPFAQDFMSKIDPASSPLRPKFGAAVLEALHQSRRRQAVREIDGYRHLIDDVKAGELWRAIERSRAEASRKKRSGTSSFVLLIGRARRWMRWLAISSVS
jgi:hypothetical protein